MKLPRFLPLLFLAVLPFSVASAQSQSQMNQEEYARFEKADSNLNKVYAQLLAKLDAEGKTKLRAAQRAWVAFRDAQSELEADLMRGGRATARWFAPGEYRAPHRGSQADAQHAQRSVTDGPKIIPPCWRACRARVALLPAA